MVVLNKYSSNKTESVLLKNNEPPY